MPSGVYAPLAVVDGDVANGIISTSSTTPTNCTSGVKYVTDGTLFVCTAAGVYDQAQPNWLTSGSAADCWLEWAEDGASPDSMDTPPTATPPRLQMSAGDITFQNTVTVTSNELVDINISIYDSITGGNLLDSFQITLDAEEAAA